MVSTTLGEPNFCSCNDGGPYEVQCVDSTDNYPIINQYEEEADKREDARKSFKRFTNPEPAKSFDSYRHPNQTR